jgi:transposase
MPGSFPLDWDRQKIIGPASKESGAAGLPLVIGGTKRRINITCSRPGLQRVPDEGSLYAPHLVEPSPSELKSTIKHDSTSEIVRKTGLVGNGIGPERGERQPSRRRGRAFGMRRSRDRGMEQPHLQQVILATALNLVRAVAWLEGEPLAKTRTSKFAALLALAA